MKDFSREWIKEYQAYAPLWSTPCEWKQVEYILQVLEPIRFCTLWMSKTRGPTIHRVFQVYDTIFDHLDNQISILEKKRMRWKVDIRQALENARVKAAKYYGKTENPRGLLMALGVCLNPYSKLDLFDDWDRVEHDGAPPPGVELYTKKYRAIFIQYYNENYRPPLETGADGDLTASITQARSSGFGRRSKLIAPRPCRLPEQNESIEYIDSPPEIDYEERSNSENNFYEPDILQFWKNNTSKYPNLSRMARDVLAVQGGSVGVERVFSMGRDVIPYRRNRLEKKSIRATMIVKSYLQKTLSEDAAGLDPDAERTRLRSVLALCDYESSITTEDSGGYISDDDESGKRDISWEFVEHDGERAFRRERAPPLPTREERKGKGKDWPELVDEEDARLGPEDDSALGEMGEEEIEDEYGYFDHDISETEELSSAREAGDLQIEEQEEDSEANIESQGKEYSIHPADLGEPQRSRKRAGSNLEGGVGKKTGKWK